MITFSNSLIHILGYCRANHGVDVLLSAYDVERMRETTATLGVWAKRHHLTLEARTGGWRVRDDAPKPPSPPPPGTPLDQLHPANKLLLMFGQPLLVQDEEAAP